MSTGEPGAAANTPSADAPLTIAKARAAMRSGSLTAADIVAACLDRIERADGQLRAFVTVTGEAAMHGAARIDAARAARESVGSLAGVPIGIKDLMETAGVRTTAGSAVLAENVPTRDAHVVRLLCQQDAIVVGKTNTHEFAFGTFTPPTRNPWDVSRVPGGSSGGSAAAIATGECLGALGTDTGGSIRIPAAACGVTGLKPTYGLVGRSGIVPLSQSLDHAGPIARTVEDCALLLDVLAGPDTEDPGSVDVPLPSYVAALAAGRSPVEAVAGMRIGVPDSYFFDPIEPGVEAAVREAITALEDLGARVEPVRVPPDMDDLLAVYRAIQRPEAYVYHERQGWLATRADRYSAAVLANIRAGRDYSAADYVRAQEQRQTFTAQMRALFERIDVLATPTLPMAAPLVSDTDRPLRVSGTEIAAGLLRCTLPFNLTGQPALSIPCGFTSDRLPVGLQLVAGHFGEPTLLRLGHAYQRVTDWHQRMPPLT